VAHEKCLLEAIKINKSCFLCKRTVHNFRLHFQCEDDDDEELQGAVAASSSDISSAASLKLIMKRFDQLSMEIKGISRGNNGKNNNKVDNDVLNELIEKNEKLERENLALREIHEMQALIQINSEKEIEKLKDEIRERNDLINSMQLKIDTVQEENDLFGVNPNVRIGNLLDL
jgi:hypothetical protein